MLLVATIKAKACRRFYQLLEGLIKLVATTSVSIRGQFWKIVIVQQYIQYLILRHTKYALAANDFKA
jgi:hypothetical protein